MGGSFKWTQKKDGRKEVLDKIDLNSMYFFGYHGERKEDRAYGQTFAVDAKLYLPLKRPGIHADLSYAVNITSVYRDIEKIMHGRSMDLMTKLAERICFLLLEGYPLIRKVQISVRAVELDDAIPTDAKELPSDQDLTKILAQSEFSNSAVTLIRTMEDYTDVWRRGNLDSDLDD